MTTSAVWALVSKLAAQLPRQEKAWDTEQNPMWPQLT